MEPVGPAVGISFLALFLIIFSVVGIIGTAFWVWMIIDCAINEPSEGNDKVVWILIIIFTHLLGALIYFFVRTLPRLSARSVKPPPVQSPPAR